MASKHFVLNTLETSCYKEIIFFFLISLMIPADRQKRACLSLPFLLMPKIKIYYKI